MAVALASRSELETSAQLLRELWPSEAIGACVLDSVGRISEATDVFERAAGRPAQGLLFVSFLAEAQRGALTVFLERCGEVWSTLRVGLFPDERGIPRDYVLWARAVGDGVLVVAEPSWADLTILNDRLMALNDELIKARRSLGDLYRREREHALKLQESLLPNSMPAIPGIEIATWYQPASDELLVGGDFFDVFEMSGGFASMIGDVRGKGVEAASVTSLVRNSVRAFSVYESEPRSVLALTSSTLQRDGAQTDEEFCTAALAFFRVESSVVRFSLSLAGHPQPIAVRADGRVARTGAPGTPLGVFDDPQLEEISGELGPGDSLVFYTDGVADDTDARALATSEFEDLLRPTVGDGAEVIVSAVRGEVLARSEKRPLRDDAALLILRVSKTGD